MIRPPPPGTAHRLPLPRVIFGEVTRSVQWRCPNMRRHFDYGKDDRRYLPRPCPDCYSLIVTSEVVPYRPGDVTA